MLSNALTFVAMAAAFLQSLVSGTISSYREIFSEERIPRLLEVVVFIWFFADIALPTALSIIELETNRSVFVSVLGAIAATIAYPAAYSEHFERGLLKVSIGDYIKTRLAAILFSFILLGLSLPVIFLVIFIFSLTRSMLAS